MYFVIFDDVYFDVDDVRFYMILLYVDMILPWAWVKHVISLHQKFPRVPIGDRRRGKGRTKVRCQSWHLERHSKYDKRIVPLPSYRRHLFGLGTFLKNIGVI